MGTRRTATKGKITIIVDGASIELTPDRVDVNAIRLDADNPRIRFLVKSHGFVSPTEEQLKELLFQVSGVGQLMRKIRVNKGTIDPIIVKLDGTVIEGNCRLCCYRHLHDADKQNPVWKTIPILRLPDVTAKQVDILLSKYHVSGKISWRSYAQAGQVHRLRHTHSMSDAKISEVVGISEKQVQDLLNTYEVMTNGILPKLKGTRGLRKFSHIYEFFKSSDSEVQKFRTKKGIGEFASWVVDNKIKKGADVRDLPKILRNPKLLGTLRTEKDGGKKALEQVRRPSELAALEKALDVLGNLKPTVIERLKSDKVEQRLLRSLHEKLEDVAGMADIDL